MTVRVGGVSEHTITCSSRSSHLRTSQNLHVLVAQVVVVVWKYNRFFIFWGEVHLRTDAPHAPLQHSHAHAERSSPQVAGSPLFWCVAPLVWASPSWWCFGLFIIVRRPGVRKAAPRSSAGKERRKSTGTERDRGRGGRIYFGTDCQDRETPGAPPTGRGRASRSEGTQFTSLSVDVHTFWKLGWI